MLKSVIVYASRTLTPSRHRWLIYCIALNRTGSIAFAGATSSSNFPTLHPLQATIGGGVDAVIGMINASGTAIVYSTYLGGSGDDRAYAVALEASSNAFVAGITASTDFPTTAGAEQTTRGGGTDTFIAKLSAAARTVAYSYDGLQRLTRAVERPGTTFDYTYDLAGNRTSVSVNGRTRCVHDTRSVVIRMSMVARSGLR